MNHYDKSLIDYYQQQNADKAQIKHILGHQIVWK